MLNMHRVHALGSASRCNRTCLASSAHVSRFSRRNGVSMKAAALDSTESGQPSTSSRVDGDAIYSRPALYEAVFSYRDFKKEVKFLRDVFKSKCSGSLQRLLDLGSGPGVHALNLGTAGVSVVGLEINQAMIDYAQQKQQEASAKKPLKATVAFVQGDFKDISAAVSKLPTDQQQPFDMVTCLLGTFTHCLRNKDAAAVFKGASAALRPGGLFILELQHPGDLFDGTLYIDGGKENWEVKQGKDTKLMVEWGADFDEFDVVSQVINRTVTINVLKNDEVVQSIEEVVPARQFTVQEIELLAAGAGLSIKALYGDMDQEIGMAHEEAYRLVAVLQKDA